MPLYKYSAAEQNGQLTEGETEAESERALAEILKKEGKLLLEIKKDAEPRKSLAQMDLGKLFGFLNRVSLVDKMFFARNLMVMVSAGLSLNKALEGLAEETTNLKFRKIIEDVNQNIAKGQTFADSLRIHQEVFGDLFINMVEVGETTGKLTLILKLSANQMKKDHELRSRVTNAMMYPAMVIIALLVIGTLMMIYVVPNLAATLKELGAPLPVSTQIIISLSNIISNYLLIFILAITAAIIGIWRLFKIKKVKESFDTLILKAPIFGPLIKKLNIARFCRTFSYLLSSGVPLTRSLEITSSVLGNSVYKKTVLGAIAGVQKGQQLFAILKEHPKIFQPVVTQMIQVGEETGKLSDMLLRLALFFEEDVSNTTKNLSTIIEPLLMVVIGAAVAFFAISMLQPIYSSMGSV